MHEHQLSLRVRYSETDKMGIVYHGNYAQYLEMGRVEWLRAFGISYKDMEDDGIQLPVISLSLRYHKPAGYDDLLTVTTRLVREPLVKIEFDYEIHNQKGELLITANSVLAFMEIPTGKPIKCPEHLLEKLRDQKG